MTLWQLCKVEGLERYIKLDHGVNILQSSNNPTHLQYSPKARDFSWLQLNVSFLSLLGTSKHKIESYPILCFVTSEKKKKTFAATVQN